MRRRPIGQILVEQGEISEVDLQAALEEQERGGRRLGEILIEQGRTSWLALARAMAEQVLDIKTPPAELVEDQTSTPDPVEQLRAMAERVANLPPVPEPLPPPEPAPSHDPERELARAVAEQVATLDSPPVAQTHLLRLTPGRSDDDPEAKLQNIEALLKERQRAFMELFTTAETLRMKVARLEEILDDRDRELAKLRLRVV
jgi:type IV secretory pathway VirB10-like protein